jgi:MFS superfamily sulfate permease-like transporter
MSINGGPTVIIEVGYNPYQFNSLFQAVLAAIIVVSLQQIFEGVTELPRFARESAVDGLVWMVTFLATVVIDVDYGLLVGTACNVMAVLAWGVVPRVSVLAETHFGDVVVDNNEYINVSSTLLLQGSFKFQMNIYFA